MSEIFSNWKLKNGEILIKLSYGNSVYNKMPSDKIKYYMLQVVQQPKIVSRATLSINRSTESTLFFFFREKEIHHATEKQNERREG